MIFFHFKFLNANLRWESAALSCELREALSRARPLLPGSAFVVQSRRGNRTQQRCGVKGIHMLLDIIVQTLPQSACELAEYYVQNVFRGYCKVLSSVAADRASINKCSYSRYTSCLRNLTEAGSYELRR